ncbi:antiviral reverse transcriptase Drt4 [Yersinia enterocolitica]
MLLSEERHLYEALLRYNYFPNQKESIGEIPPCFSSRQFTPEIAELISIDNSGKKRNIGYDVIEFQATRYNNYPRRLEIAHPKPYAKLSKHIFLSWDSLKKIKENPSSMIKPEMHQDGRIIIMNYESTEEKTIRELNDGFGKRFKVKTDISNCFNSIYTHAIPWSVLGINESKEQMKIKTDPEWIWSDKLDNLQRQTKRNETNGIPIGSSTSSIIVELVLSKIDEKLREKNFEFRRYIDDYTCFCVTHESAREFLRILGQELSKFKMNINLHKTSITELPDTLHDNWVSIISAALPNIYIDDNRAIRKLHTKEIINFLDFSVKLNNKTENGSVLKYAISNIIHYIDEKSIDATFGYLINLSWHYPILIPFLDMIMSKDEFEPQKYEGKLKEILMESCIKKRSDGISWILHYLIKYDFEISNELADAVIETHDCLSICLISSTQRHDDKVKVFLNEILALESLYDIDKQWLLFYQCYLEGKCNNPYDDKCFEILKKYKVNFMPKENEHTLAEDYCFMRINPFLDEGEVIPSFSEWCNNN